MLRYVSVFEHCERSTFMRRVLIAVAMLSCGIPVLAQVAPQQQVPPQQELAPTTTRLNLSLEQRHTIREIVKDLKSVTRTKIDAAVGEPVRQDVELTAI